MFETSADRRRVLKIFDRIDICGCGTGAKFRVIFEMLKRGAEECPDRSFYKPVGDICAEAAEFIAHVMCRWGLLDHGSSVGGSWINADGRLLLEFFQEYGTREIDWPDWYKLDEDGNVRG